MWIFLSVESVLVHQKKKKKTATVKFGIILNKCCNQVLQFFRQIKKWQKIWSIMTFWFRRTPLKLAAWKWISLISTWCALKINRWFFTFWRNVCIFLCIYKLLIIFNVVNDIQPKRKCWNIFQCFSLHYWHQTYPKVTCNK